MHSTRFLIALVAGLPLAAGLCAAQEPTLEQRLERLAVELEDARVEGHIPGMSIAIVKDDAVVWARGFGLADVEAERPADEATLYAIGSTTKAFTATLIGMLVDEGQMSWDDPVTRFLPYFDLQVRSEDEHAECTLRDLLSHRHGFARMGMLMMGGQASREQVLRTAAKAEPWDDFRKGFHYCNVTYLGAGMAAGVADGSTWDEMMVARIFEPLKMSSSTLALREAQQDPRLAVGYKWDKLQEQFEVEKMLDLNVIAPAGAVNSNVLDMAQWLRLQLGRGEVDGLRLISSQRLQETWDPQVEISDGVSYGMGWMLQERHGHRIVEHGGNIDGFSAQIGLAPEQNLGYVLLMNLSVSPLQQASLGIVFDALLDEWPAQDSAASPVASAEEYELEDFEGVYVANFATFRDEAFEIQIQGDGLALNIPSQQLFALEQPDATGRWPFAISDQIAVSFQRDPEGQVIGLTVHQGGMNFQVPRQGVEQAPEVPLEVLERHVGTYVRAEGGKRVKIFILNGRLAMEDKGNWLDFTGPDAEGHVAIRARPEQGATFKTDAEGQAESMVFHGDAGDKLFTRLTEAATSELPTLEQVLTLRRTDARRAALEAAGGRKVSGRVWIAQAGVDGTLTVHSLGSERYANHMDFGLFGHVDVVCRGEQAWSYNSLRGFDSLKGEELTQAVLGHPGAVEGDWNDYFDSIEIVRNDLVDERAVHVLRLQKAGVPSRTYWVDAENGDVLRVNQIAIESSIRIPVTIDYAEFKELDGIRRASRVVIENPMSGRTVLTFEQAESGLELGDEVFTLVDPDGE